MRRGEIDGLWGGWAQDAALVTVLALFLATIGPYGSYLNGPFWQRLVFQLPCCWLACALMGTGVRLALAQFSPGAALWGTVFAIAAVAMLPVMLINIVLAQWLWPFLSRSMTPLAWYSQGLIIAAPMAFVFAWLGLRRQHRAELRLETLANPSPSAGLLGARPADVLCLQMEDHYVRVRTLNGSHLVLATFQQAQAALQGAPGLRAHRSWWVADSAVARAEFDGRNLRLILTDGLSVPVARSSVADVRARGWLP
ncbi:MAG TPA: LytTR family DNA-binding domain-containing protein [Phenylobacterium sp.]|jgi:hypothetical protein|uniref:LytTR family DNA-binding domain-containing protein n=1 Tax=Phenylobacterium sp. TaxID=1871053 RepID=UPI002D2DC19A|nr:LytTR family DNA-binding domain-containing protein [Phenylobacterium sp.]HZZ69760.1 LytTR family DNA-binding domain-containing protein [Phenylobacterium sp.]